MTPKGAWPRSRVLLLKQWDRYPCSTERISCSTINLAAFIIKLNGTVIYYRLLAFQSHEISRQSKTSFHILSMFHQSISSRRHKIQKTHCPKHKYPKAVHKVLTKKRRFWKQCRVNPSNCLLKAKIRECTHNARHLMQNFEEEHELWYH